MGDADERFLNLGLAIHICEAACVGSGLGSKTETVKQPYGPTGGAKSCAAFLRLTGSE
jgi:hypothetical protein